MANEFKVKNGLIVIGDLTTSGTITINGALAATQSWVASQGYLTSASLSGYATQSYVTSAISALIDAAPAALDTLNELAAALGDDASFSTTVTNSIAGKLSLTGGTLTGALNGTSASFSSNVTLGNNADLVFQDLSGTFPTTGKGFDWTLNNDGARIYAVQPGSDSIDLVFQLRDNATTNDRFVFWVDEWQGPAYDKYPLIISGGTQFDLKDSALYTNSVLRLSNSGVLQNVTGNISMFTNDAGYLTSETDTLASVTSRGNSTTNRINVRGIGNQSGGNIMIGDVGEGTSKWSYLTGTHYNATSQPQGFALIGGLSTSGGNAVVIGGNIYETNPATEIQFWTHSDTTHNLGGTQRGVINLVGNWGVGTTSPQSRLHVETSSSNIFRMVRGSTNFGFEIGGGAIGLYDYEDSVYRWYVDSIGNVGIGTTSPGYKLEVNGTFASSGQTILANAFRFYTGASDGNTAYGDFRTNPATGNSIISAKTNALYFNYDHGTGGVIFCNGSTGIVGAVDGSGNANFTGTLGIGTSNPSYKLDVAGEGKVTGKFRVGGAVMLAEPGTGVLLFGSEGGNQTAIYSASAEAIRINTAGNVGIGTTTPVQKLDVNGNISLGSWTKAGSTYVGLRRADDGSFGGGGDSGLVIESYNHASPYTGDYSQKVHLRTHLYNGGSHNVLTAYGLNVGIGTTSPGWKLHVAGESYTSGVVRIGGTNPFYFEDYGGGWYMADSSWVRTYNAKSVWVGGGLLGGDGGLTIGYGGTSYGTNNAIISGLVGIGTSVPTTKLDVRGNFLLKGDATDGGILTITRRYSTGAQTINFNNNHPGTNLDWTGARITSADAGNYNGYLDFAVSLGSNGSEAAGTAAVASVMRLTKDGNVGIGTSSPGLKLDVIGDVRASNYFVGGSSGQGFSWGNFTYGSYIDVDNSQNALRIRNTSSTIMLEVNGYLNYFTGKLGIGNNNPTYNLDVTGTGRFTSGLLSDSLNATNYPYNLTLGTSGADAGSVSITAGSTVGYNSSIYVGGGGASVAPNNIVFNTASAERMRITSGGQLLINATSSAYPTFGYNLGVKGISTQAFISIARSTQTLDSQGLAIGVDTSEGAIYLRDNLPLSIYTNNTFAMRVAANGNIGIGTTSPGGKLDVVGDNNVFIVSSKTADTTLPTKTIATFNGIYNNGGNGHNLYINSTAELGPWEFNMTKTWGGFLTFGVSGDGTARTRALYINNNNYVGVGVNPTSGDKFEVAGSVRIHTGNNWDGIQIYAGGQDGYIRGIGDEVGLHIRSEYGNVLLADDRGSVGIGTTTPVYKLDVNGNARFVNEIYVGGVWSTTYGPRNSGDPINFVDWSSNVKARLTTNSGVLAVSDRKLSLGILDLNTSGTPGQFKIKTSIPWNYGGSDFTVNIKGFRYGSSQIVSLSIGWHFYNNEFYSRNAICNGAWAPTISLAKSPDGYVIIHLPSPNYWAKLYVESVYSSNSADSYTSGWSWSDADLSDCTLIQTVPYRDLATNISGNAATATFATTAGALSSMNISQFTNNSGYITSYTETDTLQSVTSRGSSTNTTLTSTAQLGLYVNSGSASYIGVNSTSNWAYVSLLNNGSTTWDIAAYNGGGLEFRPYGNGNNAMYLNLDGSLFINSLNDGKLNLRVPSGDSSDWNYINFIGSNGVRDTYFGTDSGGTPTWWRDDNGVNITLGSSVLINGNTAWHAGNDGSGSGLDADLLDGVDSSRFVYGSGSNRRGTNNISNWNQTDYPDVAFLSSEGGSTNAPSGDYSYGMQYSFHRSGAAYRTQFVTSLYSDLDIWVRNSRDSDVWTSWKRLWHSSDFSSTNISNWNTAYGWGNHASQGYATTSYVTTQINNLINGAPGALDTLSELASALGNDASFATTVTNSIAGKVSKSGDTITSGNQQVLVLSHSANTADFNDALFLNNTTSDQQVQIGMAATGSDGNHHRVSLRAYKGTQPLEGVFGIALRQPGSAAHTQRLTLDYLGNLTIGGFLTESSSLKLKENVETSEGNLEKVVNLRPVTYNKIGSQTTELGLIAEEVAEVYPEFVQYDENGEPIGVNYSRLTAALIGAVKELTNQVQELNKKING